MNKYTKFLALMSFALVMSACQDDNIISVAPALPGDDIVFGATGYLESGDKGTRTIYGDVYEDLYGKHIQVKWVKGTDRMDIACPQSATAGNVKIAEYIVMDESNSVVKDTLDLDEEIDSIRIEDSSVTATLHRVGGAGLQWSAEDTHHFFASYPSKAMIAEKLESTLSQKEIKELGMTLDGEANAKLRGYLPVNQTPSNVPTTPNAERNGNQGYVIAPDMTYAYMVANETVETKGNVGLQFTSQMTALEFEIVASDIEQIPNEDSITHEIRILGVKLSHAKNEQIAGHFEYDYANNDFSNVDIENADAHAYVTQEFPEGLLVDAYSGFVDVTFFVFPGVPFNDGNDEVAEDSLLSKELELTVIYQIDGIHQTRTAKIRKQIEPKKKYFFADVQLPKIMADAVSVSNWFNALDDEILLSQVSIPVASNVFANPEYAYNVNKFTTQQTQTLENLWNMGVRGFELCNRSAAKPGQHTATVQAASLDTLAMIASESTIDFTFQEAIDALYKCYIKSAKEPLILVCTYASAGDGYNPYHYVANLFNSLESFCQRNTVPKSTFVQITANTRAKDIKGKIAVVVRPGDDERWMYENKVNMQGADWDLDGNNPATTDPYKMMSDITPNPTDNSPYALTSSIPLAKECKETEGVSLPIIGNIVRDVTRDATLNGSEWWNRVLVVSDWGISSWDSWHRRGGTYYNYATTATNYDMISSAGRTPKSKVKYEDLILAGTAKTLSGYYYAHDMSNSATAFIQDMTRVMKSEQEVTLNGMTYKWPESLSEKMAAIDGLFQLSVDTKGDMFSHDLYINVLSAYYGHEDHPVSFYPCYDAKGFKNAGKGGDYKSAAIDLTTYVYGILSGDNDLSSATGTNKKLAQGPWGLVMMDYIGDASNTDSRKLIDLIVLNNFKFPLAKGEGSGGGSGSTGDDIII